MCMCIYIYIYIISPPLNNNPPNKKTNLWRDFCFNYQFRRRHDYPPHKLRCLVRSTPLIITPPLINKQTLGGKLCFTINLDGGTITPLIKQQKRCLVKPPRILKNGGFVFDRRSIDVLTKSIRKASEIYVLVKTPKIGGAVDRNSIDLYYKSWWFCC